MADQYDVRSLGNGGSGAIAPGAASYYGFQRELMRRQQDAAAKQALVRQAEIDKLNAENTRANITNTTENTRSLAEQRAAAAQKIGLETTTAGLTPGTTLAPEQAAAIRKNGGAALILGKPATPEMTQGIPSEFAAAPEGAAIPEVPITPAAPATEEYEGTAAEQQTKRYQDFAERVAKSLNEKVANGEELTPVEQEALFQANSIGMTGKSSTLPAGVVVPKGAGADSGMNTPEKKYLGLISKMDSGTALTSDEASYVKHYKDQHPDAATTAKVQADAAEAAAGRTEKRQNERFAEAARVKFRTLLNTEDAKAADGLERVARAKAVLNKPSFLADALAAPEVLQIVAGGMGSGLRMTDAELNRVNSAQSYIDQLQGKLAKAGIGERVTIQEELRKSMKDIIDTVAKAKSRLERVRADFRKRIGSADNPEMVDALQSEYAMARMEALNDENPKPSGGLPPGVTVRKR